MTWNITIITGGQTSADLAALDAAMALQVPCGGWCPRGRQSEHGRISERYPLIELPTGHMESIERNVLASDGTIIIALGRPDNSAARALEFARVHKRPHLQIDAEEVSTVEAASLAQLFVESHGIGRLHIAAGRNRDGYVLDDFVRETLNHVLQSFPRSTDN